MKNLIILILLISIPAYAQQQKTLEEQRKELNEQKKKNDKWESDQRKSLADAQAAIIKNNELIAQMDAADKNRKANVEKVLNEVNATIDGFSTAQRLVSRRASFYRCVRGSLKDFGVSDLKRCRNAHSVNFTPEEEKQLNDWNSQVGLTSAEIKTQRAKLVWENQTKQTTVDFTTKQIGYLQGMKDRHSDAERGLLAQEEDAKLIKDNQNYLNCDAATPDISLEEKVPYPGAKFQGPFVGVPRDNQDGLGTCYANAAKNLLVGASQGKDVASFLDIALAYKGSGVVTSGLDAGDSCTALTRLNEKGYCPQKNAPMEIGEKNSFSDGGFLSGSRSTVYDQAIVVKLLQNFLAGKQILEKGNKDLAEQILKQSKAIVHNIMLRPNVKIPMPIVRNPIPAPWKLAELHSVLSAKNRLLTFDQLNNDYQAEYRKFYPAYVRGVIEGKSRDEIFEAFKTKMAPFIDKYQLANEMKYWKNIFMQDTESDVKSSTLKKDIAESVDFMKVMSGKQGKSDEEFLKFCDETQGDSLQFLNALQPLVKHLSELDVNTDQLYDKDGKFRDPAELMQLVVAPSCLSATNRKKFSSPMTCEGSTQSVNQIKNSNATYPEKVKMLRGKVIASLLQGYPLGNTFARHINTIVGMRFNKELQRCEYKIRESQNATSTWQAEAKLFDVMSALTEVRRK